MDKPLESNPQAHLLGKSLHVSSQFAADDNRAFSARVAHF
jgi:hypothetical protein